MGAAALDELAKPLVALFDLAPQELDGFRDVGAGVAGFLAKLCGSGLESVPLTFRFLPAVPGFRAGQVSNPI